jgi:alkaline phosphatase D
MTRIFFFLIGLSFLVTVNSMSGQLRVMTGYVGMREAQIWVGSDREHDIILRVGIKNSRALQRLIPASIKSEDGMSCKITVDLLEPGTTYVYGLAYADPQLPADDRTYEFTTQPLWQWRNDPPAFRLTTGSCAYVNETNYDRPGDPYGGDYSIYDSIAAKDPDLMLWLGDNIYLREVDFESMSAIQHRYNQSRKLPEMQKLLTACPHVAIWDDHDFGPNDANGSYIHKDLTLEAFRDYWCNPGSGIAGTCAENGMATSFTFADVDFFLLDNRFNRTGAGLKGNKTPTILGEDQLNWFLQAIAASRAPFKMVAVGGQFLNTEPYKENYSTYPIERQIILDFIDQNNIKGVIFLTGDRHCGEMSSLKLPSGNMVYDLTVSPLTSKSYDTSKEKNTLRIEKSTVADRHYAVLDFSGPRKERKLNIRMIDVKGVTRFEHTIEVKTD